METNEQDGRSPSSKLLAIVGTAGVTLFKTPGGVAYANLPTPGGRQTHPVASALMRQWLVREYYRQYETTVGRETIEQAISLMAARATFDGETEPVYVRVAYRDRALWLDLHIGYVRATAEGWTFETEAPVRFRRPKTALPLPKPVRGGSLNELRGFLNLPDDGGRTWALLLAWLLGALHPTGPYPILLLHGEKGSAKSTASRYLRDLVDPSAAKPLSPPRDAEDAAIKAHNRWVVAYDNLSFMPPWLSDVLCRQSTGGADTKRTHYSMEDETTYDLLRPCILNGITELATAGDLLDRVVIARLPVIPDSKRRRESKLDTAFEEARPRILGALLDAVVVALRDQDQVQAPELPRMADWAQWVMAAETAMGLEPGAFMAAYKGNREDAVGMELEASAVASAVLAFMNEMDQYTKKPKRETFTGTASELLKQLGYTVDEKVRRQRDWPRNGKGLSDRLWRDAGALRTAGVLVERGKSGSRFISLSKMETLRSDEVGGVDAADAEMQGNPSFRGKQEKGDTAATGAVAGGRDGATGYGCKAASGASGASEPRPGQASQGDPSGDEPVTRPAWWPAGYDPNDPSTRPASWPDDYDPNDPDSMPF
jgi:hypothetical protein